MGLVFYEKSHRYKLDGNWCPGVTTAINGGYPKDLKRWAARTVAEFVADNNDQVESLRAMGRDPMVAALAGVPFQYTEDQKLKGSQIHNLAEQLVDGTEIEVPEHLVAYVESCVEFLDTWKPKPLVVERPLAHRAHWWAGKPDLFAELPDGRIILYDYKTGASGIWPETAFQLSAYSHAEFYADENGDEHPIPDVDFCAAVWLRQDGYDVIPVKADDEVYKEFRHIKFVSEAAKRAKRSTTTLGYVGLPIQPGEAA
jgi:hypothetical protein